MSRRQSIFAVVLLLALLSAVPLVHADGEFFLFSKKFYGLVSLAGSAYLCKRGYDARSDANDHYEAYKTAAILSEADSLFQETKRDDVRSYINFTAGAGLAIYGIRALLSGGGEDAEKQPLEWRLKEDVMVDVRDDLRNKGVKLRVRKVF